MREPGLRERMERELSVEDLQAIARQCRAARIPLAKWHTCPMIARAWELVAVTSYADKLVAAGAYPTAARTRAAEYFGINAFTMFARARRARGRDRAVACRRERNAASTVSRATTETGAREADCANCT